MGQRCLISLVALVLTVTCVYSQAPTQRAQQQLAGSGNPITKTDFNLAGLPAYQPEQKVSGTIRSFGFSLGGMMSTWEESFRKYHPEIRFDDKFPSGDVAIAGLVSGVSDLGPQGRELVLTENLAFYETYGYYPTDITVMTGAYDVDGMACGLVVYVNKDNPISKLTMKQLDGIFGSERVAGLRGFKWTLEAGRSAKDDVRTWGQLGLTGEWRNKSINLYGYDIKTGTGEFFLRAILGDSHKLNWGNFKEFKDIENTDGSIYESGQQIVDALRRDRYGMAVSGVRYASPEVKAVALASQEGGPYFQANRETLIARTYPLTRITYAFLNPPPGKPLDPQVKEFLRYVFSREGQEDITRDGGYLPLNEDSIREQLKKLE